MCEMIHMLMNSVMRIPTQCISIPSHRLSVCVCVCSVTQSNLTLCDPVDCSPPCFSVHGIFQARIQGWVVTSYSRESFQPRDQTFIFALAGGFFTTEPLGNHHIVPFKYLIILLVNYTSIKLKKCK